ncbi:hypothetical protein GF325_12690 [Candidatus Bathyarchaeota archaeon]|nr:hypothetical protein [Candidatus Bathyarchaeota archaeon]
MDARQRLLVALENKEEPDRVPSFVEGMMAGFRQAAIQRFEDDILEEDILLVEGDWTLYKFYQFDGVWLHQVPIRYKSLKIQEDVQASLEGEERVDRFGRLHRKNRYGQFKYQSGFLNSMESWERWIDAGYFDVEIDTSWITRWESAYPKMIDQGLVPIPVTTCFEPIREAFSF